MVNTLFQNQNKFTSQKSYIPTHILAIRIVLIIISNLSGPSIVCIEFISAGYIKNSVVIRCSATSDQEKHIKGRSEAQSKAVNYTSCLEEGEKEEAIPPLCCLSPTV